MEFARDGDSSKVSCVVGCEAKLSVFWCLSNVDVLENITRWKGFTDE